MRLTACAFLLDGLGLLCAFALVALLPTAGSHDDHFALALLWLGRFQQAGWILTVSSAGALALSIAGVTVRRERGILAVLAIVVSAALLLVAGAAVLR